MDKESFLTLAELEHDSPSDIARLLFDLSEIADGQNLAPDTPGLQIFDRLIADDSKKLKDIMLDQDEVVFSFSAVFQFVLWSNIDRSERLEEILNTLQELKAQGGRGENKFIRVVEDTIERTMASRKAVNAKMAALTAHLQQLQERPGEDSEAVAQKIKAITRQLDQLHQETANDTQAYIDRLEGLSADLDQMQNDMKKEQERIGSFKKALNYGFMVAAVAVVVLIYLIWTNI